MERPRSISKSWLKEGFCGKCARAEAISCWSSLEGEHTFSTLTFTGGRSWAAACKLRRKINRRVDRTRHSSKFSWQVAGESEQGSEPNARSGSISHTALYRNRAARPDPSLRKGGLLGMTDMTEHGSGARAEHL